MSESPAPAPVVGAALKWAPLRPVVDPLTGVPVRDDLSNGISGADRAALEVALRLAGHLGGSVRAATVGPAGAGAVVREALDAGAREGVHVLVEEPLPAGSPASCARTVRGLASVLGGCAFVVCGDYSADGGSGSVPGLLAAEVGAGQALGLLAVEVDGPAGAAVAERRLDRGVRERVRVTAPAILSVEATAARLRRASLTDVLEARALPVRVVRPDSSSPDGVVAATVGPFRPRVRVVAPPDPSLPPAARMRALLGIDGEERQAVRVLQAEPVEAAREIVAQLRRWGYA